MYHPEVRQLTEELIFRRLSKLPEDWLLQFKRMHSPKDKEKPVEAILSELEDGSLTNLLNQVNNSLKKLKIEY